MQDQNYNEKLQSIQQARKVAYQLFEQIETAEKRQRWLQKWKRRLQTALLLIFLIILTIIAWNFGKK
jgi:predicted anti-sigma-YlaC factor YlaD